jgi:hypothetical protein
LIEHDTALLAVQVRVELLPLVIEVGEAVRVTVGVNTHIDPDCRVSVPLLHAYVAEPVSGESRSSTNPVLPLLMLAVVAEHLVPQVTD